jgi:hypothetical protein
MYLIATERSGAMQLPQSSFGYYVWFSVTGELLAAKLQSRSREARVQSSRVDSTGSQTQNDFYTL